MAGTKNRYWILFIFLIFLSSFGAREVMAAEDYTKNIEIVDTAIKFSQSERPLVAYLYMELKNNGDKNIANLNFEISYSDKEGWLMKKVVLKNKLTETIPRGEARKYRIRLNGDVFNERYEEYPYSKRDEVAEFDVKIMKVKFARK